MRVYYLEEPLSDGDLAFVAGAFGLPTAPEQVRIPYVLPILAHDRDYEEQAAAHEQLIRGHLRRAGIAKEHGQVFLVAPTDLHWYSVLIRAVRAETGAYPYLVQTSAQRAAIGNPGSTRILDAQGLMGLKS
jgi:hypothetical protein